MRHVILLATLISALLLSASAAYGQRLYVSDGVGAIARADVNGESAAQVVAGGTSRFALASDAAGNIYAALANGGIERRLQDGTEAVVLSPVRSNFLAVNAAGERICFVDVDEVRCLDGTGTDLGAVETLIGEPVGLAIDDVTGDLFYVDADGSSSCSLRRGSLAGGATTIIDLSTVGASVCSAQQAPVAVDSINRRLYYVDDSGIRSAALDGTDQVGVVPSAFPRDMAVDGAGGRLFANPVQNLAFANLDGSAFTTLGLDASFLAFSSRPLPAELVVVRVEPPNDTCIAGGFFREVGFDDGAATADDGILQPGEVDSSELICDGTCTLVDNGDGTSTISCSDGTSVTFEQGADGADGADGENGANGADGAPCTVVENDDGSATITCPGGDSATVAGGGCGCGASTVPTAGVGLVALAALARWRRRAALAQRPAARSRP